MYRPILALLALSLLDGCPNIPVRIAAGSHDDAGVADTPDAQAPCVAGTVDCSGVQVVYCSAAGTWVIEADCSIGCFNGACLMPDAGEPADAGADAGAGSDAIDGGAQGDGGSGLPPGCAPETQFIYAIANDSVNTLYRFSPATLGFQPIGPVSCPNEMQLVRSIAIDRSGVAWTLFDDGQLFQVNTMTAACTATSFVPNQGAFGTFAMAFSSNAAGSSTETLFVSSDSTNLLGYVDPATLTVHTIGPYVGLTWPVQGGSPDEVPTIALTGTGAGALDIALPGVDLALPGAEFLELLAGIAKVNAGALWQESVDLSAAGVDNSVCSGQCGGGSYVSLAQWAGVLYLFDVGDNNTFVFTLNPLTGANALATVTALGIASAGSSTCVPSQ